MFRRLRPIVGVSAVCLGLAFGVSSGSVHGAPPPMPALPKNAVTDFTVSGFTASTKGTLDIKGRGRCRVRADIMDLSSPQPAAHPVYSKFLDPAELPLSLDEIGPLPAGSYRAYLIGYDKSICPVQGPDHNAGGWYVDFKVASASASPGQPKGTSGADHSPILPRGGSVPSSKFAPANGQLVALSVPGGSFAEDETQKLLANGAGGCGFVLAISNASYGGTYAQSFSVAPMKLDGGASLYNGTHFGTLAEGSYHATATGKNGCTGAASIDFKVTPKTSTKKVLGKPVLSFEQQPKSGSAFTRTKDSSIWFKVTLPMSIKDEPSAGCCEVEFDYQNEYGGWEPLPNSPFTDSGFGLALKQQAGVNNKSVSSFNNGTVWRMKVRAYKYKTEFEWSDWLEFRVDQN